MVASAAGMGAVAVKDMRRLENIQASIREQESVKQEVQKGKMELQNKMEQAREDLKEIPDSLRALKNRRLMDHSFGLAKAEANLEQQASRVAKRLEYLEGEERAVKSHFVRWSLALGAAEFLLVGGIVVLALKKKPQR